MVNTTTNESFQLWQDNEAPWEHRSDFEKLDNIFSGTRTVTAFATDKISIRGALYEFDGTITASSTSSTTYTVSGTFNELIVLAQSGDSGIGFDELQVNGDTGANYSYVDNSDTQTTGANQWSIPRPYQRSYLQIGEFRSGNRLSFATPLLTGATGLSVGGFNANVSGPITQFTLTDSGAASRSVNLVVLGRATTV